MTETSAQTRYLVTDAFGSRVAPEALVAGVQACGLSRGAIVLHDHGLDLQFDSATPGGEGGDAVSAAITWLRSRLSPLVPMRAVAQEGAVPDEGGDDTATLVLRDQRTHGPLSVALAECDSPDGFEAAVASLLDRLDLEGASSPESAAPDCATPPVDAPGLHQALDVLAAAWSTGLRAHGQSPRSASLLWWDFASGAVSVIGQPGPSGPHLAVWWRPGSAEGDSGVRPAFVLAASTDPTALQWLAGALGDAPASDNGPAVRLDGLVWGAARRPTVAVPAAGDLNPIRVTDSRCDGCGTCAAVCPVDYLDLRGKPALPDPAACIRCYECVDACPTDALRPSQADDTGTLSSAIAHRDGWLGRLRGGQGPAFPASFPPSWLQPNVSDTAATVPRVVLGLAVMTMQEHAAALVVDGVLVGAIEEEKLSRVRHHGFRAQGRPEFITAAVDPTLCLEEILCRRAVRVLLAEAGLTLDDVDLIAVNGLHGRFRNAFSLLDTEAPIPFLQAGRVAYVPHHLCHAASAFRVSGAEEGVVFTVDGRGDRETAAIFTADTDGTLTPVHTLLSLTDRSIGGVYEGVTRILGFGSHGQGSVMALAGFGEPNCDMDAHLSVRSATDYTIHESGVNAAFGDRARAFGAPLEQQHFDLAASVQTALENAAVALVGSVADAHTSDDGGVLPSLSMAGGVALNCHMNERLRQTFKPERVFAQPGANDGGTALGAAAEALFQVGGPARLPEMRHALWGPAFDDDAIEAALRKWGLPYTRVADVPAEVGRRVAEGDVFCWFQGRMEYGPRALGARSIVADPRSAAVKDRVNDMKDRQHWRPFGPSMLAGHEGDWLEQAFDSRFMLFTLTVTEAQRERIPAVVHVDGTTRPQVVHPDTHPEYHAMIAAFHERTGVPMVLNTSFNRRGEPIVCTPDDAIDAFLGLGADALAIGGFIVERPEGAPPNLAPAQQEYPALAALPGGRRLALRVTTDCDLDCVHCTMRDTRTRGNRSTDEALAAMADGRRAHCDELVFMRGELLQRDDAVTLVERARAMGYRTVQIQAHGASLSAPGVLERLLRAGATAFELQWVAGEEGLHDAITQRPGSFRAIAMAIKRVNASPAELILTIPVLRANASGLRRAVLAAKKLGTQRVQFVFPRPVELTHAVVTGPLLRLEVASQLVRQAADFAEQQGMGVATEGFPLCHLHERFHDTPDATESFGRHRIDDLTVLHEERATSLSKMRPEAAPCRGCTLAARCPKTWAMYFELFGTDELRPVDA